IITITYENIFTLMADLRGMGGGNVLTARHKKNPGREFFHRAAEIYAEHFAEEPGGRIEASVEIIYLIGWAPHETQQKPLKPGSAKTRLADALGAQETKL
ncbi:MAG TPA: SAM-dependent methyltransferase, partial [Alphaproteobacteria bacterium]|nr:SAM-dependent methyltransferase [Alphaproteobacteria bacterium]